MKTGHRPISLGLLLSIDRRETPAQALETVDLAISLGQDQVMGIDLSGDPTLNCWHDWLPALSKARQHGLKITLHAAEVRVRCNLPVQLNKARTNVTSMAGLRGVAEYSTSLRLSGSYIIWPVWILVAHFEHN